MKNNIFNFFLSLILGLGIIFIISPVVLYWWIHGNYDRYLWIIRGPYPYSDLGSGPFQLLISIGLFIIGFIFLMIYFTLNKKQKLD